MSYIFRYHITGHKWTGNLDVAMSLLNKTRCYKTVLHNHDFKYVIALCILYAVLLSLYSPNLKHCIDLQDRGVARILKKGGGNVCMCMKL